MNVANTVTSSESVTRDLRGEGLLSGDEEVMIVNAPQQILRSALEALSSRQISEMLEQFADHFTFNDQVLTLEFTDKPRLKGFFEKSRELFPDFAREIVSLFEDGDQAIAQWKLSATQTVLYGSISYRFQSLCLAQRSCASRTEELSGGRTTTTKARLGA
jgi:hypothetical protein